MAFAVVVECEFAVVECCIAVNGKCDGHISRVVVATVDVCILGVDMLGVECSTLTAY